MRIVIVLLVLLSCLQVGESQSCWFGIRGGPALGIQQWNGYERQPLFAGHVGVFVETLDEDKTLGSLFASLGLHQRGSSVRPRFSSIQNTQISGINFKFNNISLQLGAKKFFKGDFYYMLALRGEYTAFTNLKKLEERYNSSFFPLEGFVRPVTGGFTAGGGWQYEISELYGVSVELSVSPDFFNQYNSPLIEGVVSPFNGQPVTIRANQIRNTTVELTVAMRFLRKVEYY